MARALLLASVIALCVSSAFGQAEQVQTGFVAITPVVGSGQGLIVFARFQYETEEESIQSTGWAGGVVTRTSMVVMSEGSSGRNTGIAIVNPGTTTASLTMTLKNTTGTTVSTRNISLSGRRQLSQFAGELMNQPTVNGILTISSNVPISVLGFQFQGLSFSAIPTDTAFGETALLVPQVVTGGGWSSQVVMANNTGSDQTVRVDFYNRQGGITRTLQNVRIRAGGITEVAP